MYQSDQDRSLPREVAPARAQPGGQERLWEEVERSREYLAVAAAIQGELNGLHAELAARYQPSLEERAHRLAIERDEALVTWGRSILGLEALGVMTRLHFPEQSTPPVRAKGVAPSWFQSLEEAPADDDARLLGDPLQSSAAPSPPAAVSSPLSALHVGGAQDGGAQDGGALDEALSSPVELIAKLITELDDDEEVIEDDAPEDPGVAEVKHVQLSPSDLQDLQDKLSQQRGWAHQEPAELSPQSWREDAEALSLRLGAPRGQLDPALIKQSLLDIESEVECCQQWGSFDREVQNAVLSLITSRLRKLQGHIGGNLFDQDRVAKLFRRLTRYSSDFRPGFVQALSRDKTPSNDSWEADEREAWKRLERLLDISPPLPKLSDEQERALERLKEISTKASTTDNFSQELREAVSKCLGAGLPSESRHLTEWVLPHLSHLSGRRFKSLRQAQSQLG